jgi:hypothetical protein
MSRPVVWLCLLLCSCGAGGGLPADAGRASDAGSDAAPGLPDGPPIRQSCTGELGSEVSETHGRLDGILVAIVPPGNGGCNADGDHVHLQVRVDGEVYDVAVNVDAASGDVLYLEHDAPLTAGAWSEGWHPGDPLDYLSLGLHDSDFAAQSESALVSAITSALATANHVSIYGTGYGSDGLHLVHRNHGFDGAIVVRPLSASPHYLLFDFVDEPF